MPSSVTEEDVLKLRDARYLTYEIRIGCLPEGKLSQLPSLARAPCSCLTSVGV